MITSEPGVLSHMDKEINRVPVTPSPAFLRPVPSMIGIKIAIIGAFLFSLVSLAGAGILYQTLHLERKDRAALEASKIQLQDQIETLTQENERSRSQVDRMREQYRTYTDETAKLKTQLELKENDLVNLRKKSQTLEVKNASLESQLESMKPSVQASPIIPAAESSTPSQQVAAVTSSDVKHDQPKAAKEDNKPLTEAVPQKVAAKAETPAKEQKSVASDASVTESAPHVMTINRKFNFVVVNVGIKNDLKLGDKMTVERDGKKVGTIQAEKLYDRFAAATILDESKKMKIEKGDTVRKG